MLFSSLKKLSERAAASPRARVEEVQLSLLNTALLEVTSSCTSFLISVSLEHYRSSQSVRNVFFF